MDTDKSAADGMFFSCAMIFLVATVVSSGWGAHLVWGGLCVAYTMGGLIARQRARRQEAGAQAQAEAALAAVAAAAQASAAAALAPRAAGPVPSLSIVRPGTLRPAAANAVRRAPAIAS